MEMISQKENLQVNNNTKNQKNGVRFDVFLDNCKENSAIQTTHRFNRTQQKFKTLIKTNSQNMINFKRNSRTNRNIIYKQNQNQNTQLKKALQDIQERGATFYKLGFLSNQKTGKRRKKYGDYFNLKFEDMKGTMSTGQLWSNKQRSNFLKENRIYVNKVKLIEKINAQRKLNDSQKKMNETQTTIFPSFSNSLLSSNFGSDKNFSSLKIHGNENKLKLSQDLITLRSQIKNLRKFSEEEQVKNMLRTLQYQTQNINDIQKKYFIKLIEML